MRGLVASLLLLAAGAWPLAAQDFSFAVRHHHAFKDCKGTLKISRGGLEFQASERKDVRKWKFDEIRMIEILSPTAISLVSYEDQKRYLGKDRVFEFTLLQGKVTPELSAFLLSTIKRPMLLNVFPEDEKPVFEIPVKHLHTITGAMGVLRIYPDKVIFQSAKAGESRLWRIADIERFGQPDRYRLQVSSFEPKAGGPTQVYNFQLLQDLPEAMLDYLWVRLHPSTYYPGVKRD